MKQQQQCQSERELFAKNHMITTIPSSPFPRGISAGARMSLLGQRGKLNYNKM